MNLPVNDLHDIKIRHLQIENAGIPQNSAIIWLSPPTSPPSEILY